MSKIDLFNPSELECIEPETPMDQINTIENVDVNIPIGIFQSINRNLENIFLDMRNLNEMYIQKDISETTDNTQPSSLLHMYMRSFLKETLSKKGVFYVVGRGISDNLCVFLDDKISQDQFLVEIPIWSLGSYLPIKSSKLRKERELIIENKVFEDLTSLSSKIKKTDKTEEKINLLIKLDNLMKNNKELIKKKFHDNIVSILNSL